MQQRREPPDSLDFFPTPLFATRALCEIVLPKLGLSLDGAKVWEPACGEGHMSAPLSEYAKAVATSDVHDYGAGQHAVGSFVGEGVDVALSPWGGRVDWVITNPPFNLAEAFLARALREADAVAFLVRTSWLEGGERYREIFAKTPPVAIAQFCERVPMVKGRWDPKASTATSYCWVVWLRGAAIETRFIWIPPGQRQALTRAGDVERFARCKETAPA